MLIHATAARWPGNRRESRHCPHRGDPGHAERAAGRQLSCRAAVACSRRLCILVSSSIGCFSSDVGGKEGHGPSGSMLSGNPLLVAERRPTVIGPLEMRRIPAIMQFYIELIVTHRTAVCLSESRPIPLTLPSVPSAGLLRYRVFTIACMRPIETQDMNTIFETYS